MSGRPAPRPSGIRRPGPGRTRRVGWKTVFFGLEIAAIGSYNGLQVSGGAASVGKATTRTVVLASISILISDFFLTKLFLAF